MIETGITLGFDAIGGGKMASDILTAMERAASRNASGLNTYGSSEHKQVYLYGSLDFSPTTLNRAYGMTWSIGGWLMPMLLARIGREVAPARSGRTIFASDYTAELSLHEMITPDAISRYLPKKEASYSAEGFNIVYLKKIKIALHLRNVHALSLQIAPSAHAMFDLPPLPCQRCVGHWQPSEWSWVFCSSSRG